MKPQNDPMPTNSLGALMDHAAGFAALCFDSMEEVHPMWICETQKGERLCISTPMIGPPENNNKDAISDGLRAMFAEKNVIRYVFVCEAWTLRPGTVKSLKDVPTSISQRPDRVEALILNGEDDEGNTIMVMYDIKRDKKPAYLADRQVVTGSEVMGRFCNMLAHRQQTRQ